MTVDSHNGAAAIVPEMPLQLRLPASSTPAIPTSDIKLGRELTRGGVGAVHAGNWLGTAVAVKVVLDPSNQEALLREAALLASLHHPCICQFFGTSQVDGNVLVVMELLECSLHELIAARAIPVGLCLRLAHETAQGIAYLHRNSMLHRDIKSSNVMLDQLQHAKVCDFGLSRPFTISKEQLGDTAHLFASSLDVSTCAIGTLRYVAPEVLQRTEEQVKIQYSERSDVYSFGLLLWELAHRQTAYAGADGVQVAIVLAPSGERPSLQLPIGLEALGPLITSCWHLDPALRPTMAASVWRLHALVLEAALGGISAQMLPEGSASSGEWRGVTFPPITSPI